MLSRKADYFPIREVTFSCTDAEISYKLGHSTYSLFAYTADVPYEAVIIVAFCLPPFIVSFAKLVQHYGVNRMSVFPLYDILLNVPQCDCVVAHHSGKIWLIRLPACSALTPRFTVSAPSTLQKVYDRKYAVNVHISLRNIFLGVFFLAANHRFICVHQFAELCGICSTNRSIPALTRGCSMSFLCVGVQYAPLQRLGGNRKVTPVIAISSS